MSRKLPIFAKLAPNRAGNFASLRGSHELLLICRNAARHTVVFVGRETTRLFQVLATRMNRDRQTPGESESGFGADAQSADGRADSDRSPRDNVVADVSTTDRDGSSCDRTLGSSDVAALRAALMRLPPAYRMAIEMRNLSRRSFDELAERLGGTADSARQLWLRALVRLNEEMRNSGNQNGVAAPHDRQQ